MKYDLKAMFIQNMFPAGLVLFCFGTAVVQLCIALLGTHSERFIACIGALIVAALLVHTRMQRLHRYAPKGMLRVIYVNLSANTEKVEQDCASTAQAYAFIREYHKTLDTHHYLLILDEQARIVETRCC